MKGLKTRQFVASGTLLVVFALALYFGGCVDMYSRSLVWFFARFIPLALVAGLAMLWLEALENKEQALRERINDDLQRRRNLPRIPMGSRQARTNKNNG